MNIAAALCLNDLWLDLDGHTVASARAGQRVGRLAIDGDRGASCCLRAERDRSTGLIYKTASCRVVEVRIPAERHIASWNYARI